MTQSILDKIVLLEKQLSQNKKQSSKTYLDTLEVLGTAYLEVGRHTDGLQCFIRRVKIKPESAYNHCSLGWAYLHLGDFLSAKGAYIRACDISPTLVRAISGLTDVCFRLGDFDAAYENIQHLFINKRVLKVDESIAALRVYSKICHQYNKYDECSEILIAGLKNSKTSKESRISLFYALAAMQDKKGQYEMAFKNYTHANELSQLHYSHKLECSKNEAMISAFYPSKIPAPINKKNHSVSPIFIIGMPRSGTSLIEQILSRHKKVFAAGELATVTDISNVLFEQCSYPSTLDNLTENVLEQAANHYSLTVEKLTKGEKYVTDKMPANFVHLGLISLLFPNATIIHAQRNPMDVCLSIYFQRFPGTHSYSTKLKNIALYYNEYVRYMEHWKNVLPIKIHNVYYEQLVRQQEHVTRTLLENCHLDWEPDCLAFHHSNRVATTASQDQVKRKIYDTSIDKWESYAPFIAAEFNEIMTSQNSQYLDILSKEMS